jgi:hypothetical protein
MSEEERKKAGVVRSKRYLEKNRETVNARETCPLSSNQTNKAAPTSASTIPVSISILWSIKISVSTHRRQQRRSTISYVEFPDEFLSTRASHIPRVPRHDHLISIEFEIPSDSRFDPLQRVLVPHRPILALGLNAKIHGSTAAAPHLEQVVIQVVLAVPRLIDHAHVFIIDVYPYSRRPIVCPWCSNWHARLSFVPTKS